MWLSKIQKHDWNNAISVKGLLISVSVINSFFKQKYLQIGFNRDVLLTTFIMFPSIHIKPQMKSSLSQINVNQENITPQLYHFMQELTTFHTSCNFQCNFYNSCLIQLPKHRHLVLPEMLCSTWDSAQGQQMQTRTYRRPLPT